MEKKERPETEEIMDSFFKHVLVNFVVIIFMAMLLFLSMTMA